MHGSTQSIMYTGPERAGSLLRVTQLPGDE